MAERLSLTDRAAPALKFDVYDVELPDGYSHWVESVDNRSVAPVWLGHRAQDGQEAALVGTLPRAVFPSGASPLEWASPGMSIGRLMDVIEPFTLPEERSNLGRRVRQHLEEQAAHSEDWPRVTWTVAGNRATAMLLHFAGAWLAITEELPESYLAVIGVGISPDGLDLTVTRGERYGLDFAASVTVGQFRQRPVGRMPQPNMPHPDLLPLLLATS